MSRSRLPGYEPVAQVDEARCFHLVLFLVGWGEDASHEALITDLLARHHGDAIGDAELTYTQVPAVLYNRFCAEVKGTVLRRKASAAAPPPAPPSERDLEGGAK